MQKVIINICVEFWKVKEGIGWKLIIERVPLSGWNQITEKIDRTSLRKI